ncbi:MAG: hypothetical protein RL141_691 [Candidatus Parcubacteria bacterium]|jgi:uncharacterized protein YqeY
MTLLERIDADLKEAMKAKNEQELSTLRLVRAAFKNKQIDTGHPVTEEEATAVLKTLQKQYQDALADFQKADRADLADRQQAELVVIRRYLPEAMPEADVEKIVVASIAALGATSVADVGKVMGAAMKTAAGRADGNMVRAIAQRLLGA